MNEKRMSLYGHLSELRTRLTWSLGAIFIGFFIAYSFHLELFELVVYPVRDSLAERGLYRLQALHVTESIFVYIKLSAVAGIMGAFPFIIYQIWAFISPGLLEEERRYVTPIVIFSSIFFALGVLFSYTVLLPFVTGFLTDLTLGSQAIELQVTVQNVFSFSLLSLLMFGLVFQLPILMFFMALLGVASHKGFLSFYRYFIVLSFVIAAMLTPPEPVSQILMALPMNLLYGLGILIAFMIGSRKKDAESGEYVPIGFRIWFTVASVLLVFVGGIIGGVWLLQPGPKGTDLVPARSIALVGFNPSKTESLPFGETVGNLSGLTPEPQKELANVLTNKELRSVMYFQIETGEGAIILPAKALENSPLVAMFDKPSTHEADLGMTHVDGKEATALYSLSSDWMALGQPGALEAAKECMSDETACLRIDADVEKQLVELRTGGPAWAWLPGSSNGTSLFPYGKESEGVQSITWLLSLEQGVDVYGSMVMSSEAASRTYKTRVDLWREQERIAMEDEEISNSLVADVKTLAEAIGILAETTEKALETAERAIPMEERKELTQRNQPIRTKLNDIVATSKSLAANANAKATREETPTNNTGFTVHLPKAELKDWTLTTEDKQARYHIQTTSVGIREWVSALKDWTP